MNKSKVELRWLDTKRHRLRMTAIMFAADLLGFSAAVSAAFITGIWLGAPRSDVEEPKYLIVTLICLILYASSKLYPGAGLNPAEEIRLVFLYTWAGSLVSLLMFGVIESAWNSNYWVFILFGCFSIPSVLVSRWAFRIISRNLKLWGMPVVVIGSAKNASRLANYFLNRRRLGFLPERIINLDGGRINTDMPVPVFGRNDFARARLPGDVSGSPIHTALIDVSDASGMLTGESLQKLSRLFPHLIFVSNMAWMGGASLQIHDLEGLSALEAQKSTLSPFEAFTKRCMDVVFSILIGTITAPLWLLALVLIPLDSPGPVLYIQKRVGKNRRKRERPGKHKRPVNIYKFRTMLVNAEQALSDYLNANSIARLEWEQHQKLKDDPRITRVGKWLRKFSIDELPQLINVLKGEMSLVGPRPLPEYHHELFPAENQRIRDTVKPGLTGMWQVSGRSNSDTQDMELWDLYYIHNWSVWLDMYILARTVWVVLNRDGAY
jgi:Undecaprenyl-phosphate galactose phosphotransferase WbaP